MKGGSLGAHSPVVRGLFAKGGCLGDVWRLLEGRLGTKNQLEIRKELKQLVLNIPGGLGGLKLDEIAAANPFPMLPMARR